VGAVPYSVCLHVGSFVFKVCYVFQSNWCVFVSCCWYPRRDVLLNMALKFDAPFLAILCVFSLELWHVHPLFKCNCSQLVDYALNTLTAKFHTPLGFSCLDLVWCGNTVSRLSCIPQTRLFNKHEVLFNDCIHYYFSVTPTKARHVEKRNLRKELYI
jgi:hypothetical protein